MPGAMTLALLASQSDGLTIIVSYEGSCMKPPGTATLALHAHDGAQKLLQCLKQLRFGDVADTHAKADD